MDNNDSIINTPPRLSHLKRLTTKDGLVQHSDLDLPDPSFGYSIDDNARGLIVVLKYHRLYSNPSLVNLAWIYLNFIKKAQLKNGKFHNFLSYDGRYLDRAGSEDSLGRTIWALGFASGRGTEKKIAQTAQKVCLDSLKWVKSLKHLRSKAYAILGCYYLKKEELVRHLADSLVNSYQLHQDSKWHWFENTIRYCNGIIPTSLFFAYRISKKKEYLNVARESLDWLLEECQIEGIPVPIGQNGWFHQGGDKAIYDQQPIDPSNLVSACLAAYQATKEKKYYYLAKDWWRWFWGNNLQNVVLVNESGSAYDALTPNGPNLNQGAESTLAYLLATLELAYSLRKNNEKIL
jgi:hypothetical protein